MASPKLETATLQRTRVRGHWLGWVALSVAIVFALVLVVMAFSGAADALFSVTVFAVQLAVIAAVVAALITKRARRLGIVSLAVVLLCNVATVGSLGVLQTASAGSYAVSKSTGQLHREAFPGLRTTQSRRFSPSRRSRQSGTVSQRYLRRFGIGSAATTGSAGRRPATNR
ncbi:hypothetical protein G7066_13890 [Leucobacter coleopterorum]|uniref:Uncharacterized protein n=1 Tax=Leucobacter coleopterorum TaxID=2714933 RepID=A0ABX6K2L1_9MICO|nr:hypothetical protein [Leucobacter coleopterorum]QIM19395.1 hypothetical protein G7066_13890 [Leucobacter coleopterorum]